MFWREASFPGLEGPRETILNLAGNLIGSSAARYTGPSSGTEPDKGFDCSGFALYVLLEAQKMFPKLIIPDGIRHANEMWDKLGVVVHSEFAKPGDLVIFGHSGAAPRHVGIFWGVADNARRYMIHSPGISGRHVEIAPITSEHIMHPSRHSLYANTLIGYKRLTIMDRNTRWGQSPI